MKSINYALLFLGCVLFHIIGTWGLPLIDRDEPRFAEATREMIERRDYIVPYFNNQFRLDKPPLAYWAQVASYKIFGENDFAARFPSAIAAAFVALTVFAWGSRWDGERVGFWAAIIFTLSLQTFLHAKAAVADMWLVLFVTIAHWAGYELLGFAQPQAAEADSTIQRFSDLTIGRLRGWWFVFYLSLALGFLAKGPIAWMPLLTVAAVRLFQRDVQLARRFKFARGTLFMLAIVALWGIPALIRTHGEFLTIGIGRHVIGRSVGAMEGHGGNSLAIYLLLLPFYFVTLFASLFPWSIKLPWLSKKLFRSRDFSDIYLLTGAAIVFVIFSLIKTKLPHYTLPAFPLIALLLARHWPATKHSAVTDVDCLKQSTLKNPDAEKEGAVQLPSVRAIAILTASLWLVIAIALPPLLAQRFPARALLKKSRGNLRPEMEFGAVDYQEPSLVWYFRSRVHGFFTPLNQKKAPEFMAKTGPRFIILPGQTARETFPTPPGNWKTFTTHGFNVAKGKRVELTLVMKTE